MDYFPKFIKVEAKSKIAVDKVRRFYYKQIIYSFALPKCIISENGNQFTSSALFELCHNLGIKTKFLSVEHPQANGQVESANKVILYGIKKKLK